MTSLKTAAKETRRGYKWVGLSAAVLWDTKNKYLQEKKKKKKKKKTETKRKRKSNPLSIEIFVDVHSTTS